MTNSDPNVLEEPYNVPGSTAEADPDSGPGSLIPNGFSTMGNNTGRSGE